VAPLNVKNFSSTMSLKTPSHSLSIGIARVGGGGVICCWWIFFSFFSSSPLKITV
jgi:hypothetical protein